MGCFSAVLTNSSSNDGTNQESLAGTSFYLGWFGVDLLFIAAVTAFLGHCAKKTKWHSCNVFSKIWWFEFANDATVTCVLRFCRLYFFNFCLLFYVLQYAKRYAETYPALFNCFELLWFVFGLKSKKFQNVNQYWVVQSSKTGWENFPLWERRSASIKIFF